MNDRRRPYEKVTPPAFLLSGRIKMALHFPPPPHTICLLRLPISCKFKVARAFKWTCHAIFIWVSGCRAVGLPNTKSFACPTKWGINLPLSACCLLASPQTCTVVWIWENQQLGCCFNELEQHRLLHRWLFVQNSICNVKDRIRGHRMHLQMRDTVRYAKSNAKTIQTTDEIIL